MPLVVSIFASWDFREIPREKTIMYVRALQYSAEQNNLPKKDEPCLLVEGIIELRREVKFYLSFTDEEVFREVDLPETEEGLVPATADPATTNVPGTTDVPEAQSVPKPTPERKAPKFLRWEKILHPSWPVVATGETPQPAMTPKPRGRAFQLT